MWTLGETIPDSLHACLSWEPVKPLFEDELVVVQASSAAQNNQHHQQQQAYAIARVAQSTKPKAGTAFMNVELEVQPGSFKTVRSTDIRVFRSMFSKGQDQPVERNQAQSQARDKRKLPEDTSSSSSSSIINSGEGDSALDDPAQEMAASGRDVASAISDMLVNVGLRSLTPDAKDLLEESMDLKRELESARELSDALSTKVDSLKAEIEEHESKWKCQICFANNIRSAIVPCGHTICDQCKRNLTAKCPFCRTKVQHLQVLFT